MNYCIYCGKKVSENSNFCQKCGRLLSDNKKYMIIEKLKNIKIYQLLICLVILIPFLVIGILLKVKMEKITEISQIMLFLGFLIWIKINLKDNEIKLKYILGKWKNKYFLTISYIVLVLIFNYSYTLTLYYNKITLVKYEKVSMIYLITVIILAPFTEEILFRGIIFQKYIAKYSLKYGIIVTGLIFGIVHLNITIPAKMIMSIIFSIIYYKTKSLYPAIIAHFSNNFFIIILCSQSVINNLRLIPRWGYLILMLINGILILIIVHNFLKKEKSITIIEKNYEMYEIEKVINKI